MVKRFFIFVGFIFLLSLVLFEGVYYLVRWIVNGNKNLPPPLCFVFLDKFD